jgi:hypothetical protein
MNCFVKHFFKICNIYDHYYKINSIPTVEVTVVQKLNQGTRRKMGVLFFGWLFCDTFFPQKKYQNNF